MRRTKLYGLLSLAVLVVFCVAAVAGRLIMPEPPVVEADLTAIEAEPVETPQDIDAFQEVLRYAFEQVENQKQVDADLLAELDSGEYTFADPLVAVDPYGLSQLSAAAVFTTEDEVKMSVLVKGKTQAADISFDFDDYETRHIVPIYGLYVDALTDVELTATDRNGASQTVDLQIQTDPLPTRLEKYVIQTYAPQPDKYFDGLNFSTNNKFAYDINGDYRWILSDRWGYVVQWNYDSGTFVCPIEDASQSLIIERNMLGKYIRMWYAPTGTRVIHHDIEEMPNGNLLLTANSAGTDIAAGDTVEDLVLELDVNTGEIVNSLDFAKILPRYRSSSMIENEAGVTKDWLHMNKVTYDNGDIIISSRHQNICAKVSWPDGEIKWILGSHYNWSPKWEPYLLTPIGDDFEWQYAQHFPIVLPDLDGNPDTTDIMLFDNGNSRFAEDLDLQRKILANEVNAPENYSRIVHYRINEKEMTVEQIWQYGKERGEEWFANQCGNVALFDNGNRVGSCIVGVGYWPRYSIFTEVEENGSLVWETYITTKQEVSSMYEYRQYRLPIYRQSDNDLHVGEETVNLVPDDILEKYGFNEEGN